MLETPSMQQYNKCCDNLFAADDQQGRPEAEPSTTIRTAPHNKRVKIESELHGDMQRLAEMTSPARKSW